MMEEFATSLAALGLATTQPDMHQLLNKLNTHLSTLSLTTDSLASQHRSLLAAERKGKVAEAVRGLTNPMSVRALHHNYKILHLVEDLLSVFSPNGVSLVITDVAVASDIISAASAVLIEISRLLRRENESHKVAQSSHLGWKVVQELDRKELVAEEVESNQILPAHKVRAAEKSLMSFHLDMAKTLSYSRGGGSRGGSSRGGGRGARSRRGSGKKGKSSRVDSGRVAKTGKPRSGGCHRCGGPHFVRACPKPIQKD